MAALALTVLETAAISVPLIAIVVYQLFNSDLAGQMQEEVLEYVAQLLIGTGLLFLISVVMALRWVLELSLSDPALISITARVRTVGTDRRRARASNEPVGDRGEERPAANALGDGR